MPLILCPECKREISDKAMACPGCGYPIREPGNSSVLSSATTVKTAGTVFAAWLTAPWIARLVVGVIAVIGLFAFLIVGVLMRN